MGVWVWSITNPDYIKQAYSYVYLLEVLTLPQVKVYLDPLSSSQHTSCVLGKQCEATAKSPVKIP